jgi:ATP-dependent helicase/DNAse subunit B
MAAAIEIEMAIHQAEQFEKQLQLLFMQTGKIDVWNKIKSRAAAMDIEAAHDARREKENIAKRKRQFAEAVEYTVAGILLLGVLITIIWGVYELTQYCNQVQCGR